MPINVIIHKPSKYPYKTDHSCYKGSMRHQYLFRVTGIFVGKVVDKIIGRIIVKIIKTIIVRIMDRAQPSNMAVTQDLHGIGKV